MTIDGWFLFGFLAITTVIIAAVGAALVCDSSDGIERVINVYTA